MSGSLRVHVVGGGVGGLATAVALHRAGHDVTLFEKSHPWRGGALLLWANAFRAMQRFDARGRLAEQVAALGQAVERLEFRTEDGRLLSSFETNPRGWTPLKACVVARADLIDTLERALPAERLRRGRAMQRFRVRSSGTVELELDDGERFEADVLVGADGIDSRVRRQLFGAHRHRPLGHTAWAAIATVDARSHDLIGVAAASMGRERRFCATALSPERVFWYATVGKISKATEPGEIAELFEGWHEPVQHLIRSTPREAIGRFELLDPHLEARWGRGPVTLAGDAAHPSLPDLTQGACQAFETAATLSEALARDDLPLDLALREYERQRFARARNSTRSARWINHYAMSLTRGVRDLIVPTVLEFYGYDTVRDYVLGGRARGRACHPTIFSNTDPPKRHDRETSGL